MSPMCTVKSWSISHLLYPCGHFDKADVSACIDGSLLHFENNILNRKKITPNEFHLFFEWSNICCRLRLLKIQWTLAKMKAYAFMVFLPSGITLPYEVRLCIVTREVLLSSLIHAHEIQAVPHCFPGVFRFQVLSFLVSVADFIF